MNRARSFSPRLSAGLSLVELMVSIALVSIILAGVVKLYADSHRSYLSNEGVARTQEGIRYVLDHIGRSAARAGYMGCANFEPADTFDALHTSNIENLISPDQMGRLYDFNTGPVFGTNDAGLNNSDTLILRSAKAGDGIPVESITATTVSVDGSALVSSGIDQGDAVIVSDCKNIKVFMMTNTASSSGLIQHAVATIYNLSNTRADFQGAEEIGDNQSSLATLFPATTSSIEYTIGTSAAATGACSAANPQFCALFANGQELLEGVENLQVLYGQQSGSNTRYRTADEVSDWQEVVSIEVTVTINSVDRAFTSEADSRVRKTVTHVVALRNGNL